MNPCASACCRLVCLTPACRAGTATKQHQISCLVPYCTAAITARGLNWRDACSIVSCPHLFQGMPTRPLDGMQAPLRPPGEGATFMPDWAQKTALKL